MNSQNGTVYPFSFTHKFSGPFVCLIELNERIPLVKVQYFTIFPM
jgi:hypothetical protein